jgi:hypothetical protein
MTRPSEVDKTSEYILNKSQTLIQYSMFILSFYFESVLDSFPPLSSEHI